MHLPPPQLRFTFLALGSIAFALAIFAPDSFNLSALNSIKTKRPALVILGLSGLYGLLIYLIPIAFDFYGDAFKIVERLDEKVSTIPKGAFEAIFSYKLSPWAGHETVLGIVTYIAYGCKLSYGQAFLALDLVCGMAFAGLWMSFVNKSFSNTAWKLIMGLAGLSAPFMLIFFGHIESYALIFLLNLSWILALLQYIKSDNHRWLALLLVLLFFCINFYLLTILFLPSSAHGDT